MATQNLIQYLEREGYSALPGGANVPVGPEAMHRRQLETFTVAASSTVAVGDVVQFAVANGGGATVALDVRQAPADSHALGVARTGGVSGAAPSTPALVEVVISGLAEAKVEGANNAGNTAVSSGDFLCLGDTAGTLYKYTAGTVAMPHAIAVDDVGSGATAVVSVIFLKQF